MRWRNEVARGPRMKREEGRTVLMRRDLFFFREQQRPVSSASWKRKRAGTRRKVRPDARLAKTQHRAAVAAATKRGRGRGRRQFSALCRKWQQVCLRLQQPSRGLRGFGRKAKAPGKVWQRPQVVNEGANQPAESGWQGGGPAAPWGGRRVEEEWRPAEVQGEEGEACLGADDSGASTTM